MAIKKKFRRLRRGNQNAQEIQEPQQIEQPVILPQQLDSEPQSSESSHENGQPSYPSLAGRVIEEYNEERPGRPGSFGRSVRDALLLMREHTRHRELEYGEEPAPPDQIDADEAARGPVGRLPYRTRMIHAMAAMNTIMEAQEADEAFCSLDAGPSSPRPGPHLL